MLITIVNVTFADDLDVRHSMTVNVNSAIGIRNCSFRMARFFRVGNDGFSTARTRIIMSGSNHRITGLAPRGHACVVDAVPAARTTVSPDLVHSICITLNRPVTSNDGR